MPRVLRLLCLFFIVSLASACAVNPVTGDRELSWISPAQEVAIGTKNYGPYQQQQGGRYIVDPDLTPYVAEVGRKLAVVSGRPDLPYEFVVLNNGVPNAWALPGGKIAINRGLLVELEDEAQLAAVLGHEIVHAAGKHSVQKMQQSTLLGLGVAVAGVAASGTDYGQAVAVGAGLGAGLWSARYGREQELESDAYGMEYMVKAGYNPQAAVELQQTFVRLSNSRGAKSGWLQGLFASHPPSQTRVEQNQAKAQALGRTGERGRAAYQRAIAQIKRDAPAYKKQDEAIAAASQKELAKAESLISQAIRMQPEEAQFRVTAGQIALNRDRSAEAKKAFEKGVSLNPEYYMGHLGLGLVQKRRGQSSDARRHLERSASLLPTQTAVYHLGEIALSEGDRGKAAEYFQVAAQQGGELGQRAQAQLTKMQPNQGP